jgi:hypothetical protein
MSCGADIHLAIWYGHQRADILYRMACLQVRDVVHGSCPSQQAMQRREVAGRAIKNPTRGVSGVVAKSPSLTLLTREGVYVKAMEAGLLTNGSSYSPTPSRHIFASGVSCWLSSPITVARP